MTKFAVELMLDSGVFSAWNRGETLDLDKYIAYLKRNEKYLWSYVNVDVIPGAYGRKRTQQEVDLSAKQSYDNLQYMKAEGLSPIPVFHQGEPFSWLERLLADGETYIGISSAKDVMPIEQRRWLDTVFSMLTNSDGRPLVRTHGFGITNPKFLFRYPFYTVDSTTWSLTPGYGQIIVPVYVGTEPDYMRPPIRVVVSGVQHSTTTNQKRQFEALGPIEQACIVNFLDKVVGITITQARYGTTMRRRAVLMYYLKLVENIKPILFQHRQGNLHTIPALAVKATPIKTAPVKIMFATALNREWSTLMNEVGARTRLLSYYELMNKDDSILTSYVTRGITGPNEYVKRTPKANWDEGYCNHRRFDLLQRIADYIDDEIPF